ncbi:ZIP family metal transporter [Ovoidimarina sediminis]|uniref:ZIP family metal transporter n=1 Tax=Ovoidimarina sediminis TaxID=3079856 RepID=UPI00291334E4|nr:divalent cation transporter [Rhodophyticola sp. MJ-SS7]MDU8944589.1 divalent cation transporter [Rhodophyticola sp. MJ-SS7]
MDPLATAMILAGVAGLAMPLGAGLAHVMERRLHPPTFHFITALGGGALLSAVALVLVPEGAESLGGPWTVLLFVAGGLAFFAIDQALAARGGAGSQLLAMLLDYVPEAAALGALFVVDPGTSVLLAGLIFLQNLPEGFSSFREIEEGARVPARKIILLFGALALLGPVCAATGQIFLLERPGILGGIMVFSSGGILYLIFQDIAPQTPLPGDWRPPLGAVAGFALGLAGHLATA